MVPSTASADAGSRPIILIVTNSWSIIIAWWSLKERHKQSWPSKDCWIPTARKMGPGPLLRNTQLGNMRCWCLMYCKYALLFHLPIFLILSSGTCSRDSCVALPILKLCELNFSVGSPHIDTHALRNCTSCCLSTGSPDSFRKIGPFFVPRCDNICLRMTLDSTAYSLGSGWMMATLMRCCYVYMS